MKINEIIIESPFHIPDDMEPRWIEDAAISNRAIEREFIYLGTLERDIKYDFFVHKERITALVTTKAIGSLTKEEKNKILVDLKFKTKVVLPVKNQLQVNLIVSNKEYRDRGLASILYVVLARHGYTVVSDLYQYNGGVALWEKIGRESEARNYAVRIWNIRQNDWIKDEKGEVLRWNGENLTYHEIWQHIGDIESEEKLLTLSKN